MPQNTVKAIPLTTILVASVPAAYTTAPQLTLPNPVFFLRIVNTTSNPVTISFDGTTDHEYVLSGQVFEINTQTNSLPNNKVCLFSARSTIFIKGAGGGPIDAAVTISGYYC